MKGINEFLLNEATMVEAIEYWLTNKIFNPQANASRVTGVAEVSGTVTREFRVTLTQEEA